MTATELLAQALRRAEQAHPGVPCSDATAIIAAAPDDLVICTVDELAKALYPEPYACGYCFHAGGEHGLNNVCLVADCSCGCFSSMSEAEATAHWVATIAARLREGRT